MPIDAPELDKTVGAMVGEGALLPLIHLRAQVEELHVHVP